MRNINFSLFFKINLSLTIIIFLAFIQYNSNYTLLSLFLIIISSISSATILYLLFYILLFPFSFTKRFILYLSSIIFIVTNISLIVDFFIFKLYKFHINAMVLNIILSPDAFDSIQLGIIPILLFVGVIIGLIVFEIYIIKKLFNFDIDTKINLNKKINRLITIPLILIVLSEKITYGIFSLTNQNNYTSKYNVIPLYQPLTFNRLAYKLFGYKPDKKQTNTINKNATLNYPLNPLVLAKNPNKINIFIFAFDAARNSSIDKNTAPNITQFKNDSIVLNHHYSGGNATRFGIFSLMYGINSTYWFSFLANQKGSVLFDTLKRLNYNIKIISSTNTNWPEFRKTCYVNIVKDIKDNFSGASWQKDKQSSQYFIDMIKDKKDNNPIFSFVFMDAPHGYSYPKEFNKFNASGENINYISATKGSNEIKSALARYKNAIYYDDNRFGKMIQILKDKGLYKNSLIIFTSDHGQEFYEYGNFGHNNAFSKAQVNSPMVIKLPDNLKDKLTLSHPNTLSSHIDIVPTILSLIGVKNKTSDYSNGYNIFTPNYNRDFVFSANWTSNAIITKDKTYIFSNMPNEIFNNQIRDTKTYKLLKDAKTDTKLLLKIINQNKRFIK